MRHFKSWDEHFLGRTSNKRTKSHVEVGSPLKKTPIKMLVSSSTLAKFGQAQPQLVCHFFYPKNRKQALEAISSGIVLILSRIISHKFHTIKYYLNCCLLSQPSFNPNPNLN